MPRTVVVAARWVVSCTQITCILCPVARSQFLPLLFGKWFVFVCFLFSSVMRFFLVFSLAYSSYWPSHTCLLACLIWAAILHFSFYLHLFPSQSFVISRPEYQFALSSWLLCGHPYKKKGKGGDKRRCQKFKASRCLRHDQLCHGFILKGLNGKCCQVSYPVCIQTKRSLNALTRC